MSKGSPNLFKEKNYDNKIKRGEWSLDKITAEAERLFGVAEQAFLNSSLPESVDKDAVNDLCVDVIDAALDEFDSV